jgi:SpoVK/Ycf46/Vps4 family AAA+-type ATPase
VLLEDFINLPLNLQPLIPVFSVPLPGPLQVQDSVKTFFKAKAVTQHQIDTLAAVVQACLGLPLGEIQVLLKRWATPDQSITDLAALILQHKQMKLRGRGLEFIAEPDVPYAGGLDLLSDWLDRVAALLSPEAERYGLNFPRGMLLWGPPGTGKTLSAKLAAKKMGVPLLATDWGAIIASGNSDQVLRDQLSVINSLAPVCVLFDDFDKGFAGWDSNADGGVARRLSGKLLTWMQEHEEPVFMIATVNRLGFLPVELQRRFDDIFFVDLPNEGAVYEIFNLHLARYFPLFQNAIAQESSPWSDDQWRRLLIAYRLCTPDEIGKAVQRCAQEAFYQGRPAQIQLDDLLEQRRRFVPAMVREANQMYEIRNNATYARPAAGPDHSRFARPQQSLYQSSTTTLVEHLHFLDELEQ